MELELLDAIENLKGPCTMVIISHRSSTLTNCDQIFALKNRNIERLDVNNSVSVAKEEKI
jgi:ABC-type multidrug transport system, ATPase and permease components